MGMIGNTLAQGLISGANIQDGTVDTPDMKDSAVTTAKVADGAVTSSKLASTAITDKLGYTPANAANLTNVENKSSATIRSELTFANVAAGLGYDPAYNLLPKWTLHGSQYNEAGLTSNRRIVLGTGYVPQSGADIKITLYVGSGYNADPSQYDEYVIRFRTSNGSSAAAGSAGAFYGHGWCEHIKSGGTSMPISTVYVEQVDTEHWIFSVDPSSLIGVYSHYEVSGWAKDIWTPSGAIVDGLPSLNYVSISPNAVQSGGIRLSPQQPAFNAYIASTLFNAPAVLTLTSTMFNDGSYNTSNGRFTAPISGKYFFSLTVRTATSQTYPYFAAVIRKNGAFMSGQAYTEVMTSTSALGGHFTCSAVYILNAGDYVEAYCIAGAVTMDANDNFSGYLIG